MSTERNGAMLNEMDFEQRIKKMPDRDLQEFTARQIFSVCKRCERHEKRIINLETLDRRMIVAGGGVGAVISGAVYAIIQLVKMTTGG